MTGKKGKYRNALQECGYSENEIEKRINEVWQEMFSGPNRIILKAARIWATWWIPATMMCGPRACPTA